MIIEIGNDNDSASYLYFEISDGKSVIAKCISRQVHLTLTVKISWCTIRGESLTDFQIYIVSFPTDPTLNNAEQFMPILIKKHQ